MLHSIFRQTQMSTASPILKPPPVPVLASTSSQAPTTPFPTLPQPLWAGMASTFSSMPITIVFPMSTQPPPIQVALPSIVTVPISVISPMSSQPQALHPAMASTLIPVPTTLSQISLQALSQQQAPQHQSDQSYIFQ